MDATVTPSEAIAEPGHNSDNRLLTFLEDVVADLGRQSARGVTALTDLAIHVVEAAHDGVLQPEAAKAIYERYAGACKDAGGTHGSIKTNTSKIKKLIELGCLGDGPLIAEEAMGMRHQVENAKSVFESLVDVARLRLKEKRKLMDNEIKTAITKRPKRTKPNPDEAPSVTLAPWRELVAKKDRPGLIAMRDEIEACIREIDCQVSDEEAEQTEVDEAAHAPPAATTPEEEHS